MNDERYPAEVLGEDDDNGTMPGSLESLGEAVIGHKIVSVEKGEIKTSSYWTHTGLILTLDNGSKVEMIEVDECCAYTEVEEFFLNPHLVDHVIIGVGTTDGFNTWHIYADLGDVLKLKVGWSCGNPFYYGYGFDIKVKPV